MNSSDCSLSMTRADMNLVVVSIMLSIVIAGGRCLPYCLGSCTQTVSRALEGVNGVASNSVTLGRGPGGVIGAETTGLAEVWVNAGFPGVEAAVAAVDEAGLEAQSMSKT